MAIEYRSIEYQLHESLIQIQEIITVFGFEKMLLDCVADCKNMIKNKQYNVAVMGEFKRGKSSLINALLGAKILPADATPTTATVNRITYGAHPRAVITFRSGKTQEINIGELSGYVTKITAEGEARALQIREATVYYPTVICQNNIDIIDTPGLNDEARMTQITIDMIANVDAVVVPIHARAPFSETEKKFVCQLIQSDGIHNLIFVVTFLDQLDEDDYEYDKFMDYLRRRIQTEVFAELEKRDSTGEIMRKAHLLLDGLQISGISSSLALESFVSNNRTLREKSRFKEFSNGLLRIVTAKQLEHAVRKTVENVRLILAQFDGQNQKRRKTLEDEARTLKENEDAVRRYCTGSGKTLDVLFSNDYASLQNAINSFNINKNLIVSIFIKSLSGLRENTHGKVLNALNAAAQEVSRELAGKTLILHEKIYWIFEESLLRLKEKETAALDPAASFLGISGEIQLGETVESMRRFVQTILGNAGFSWKMSYIPQVKDLANCNVIETVIRAADISVTSYIRELSQIIDVIRKNWFGQFSTHTNSFLSTAMAVITRRKEEHDLRYKAYLSNFQELSGNSKDILSRCERLWEEFEKGEIS